MAEPLVINEFLALLEKSKLMTPAQIKVAVEKLDLLTLPDCREVAQRLVNKRVLTPYQGERLLEGRYRGFVIDRYRVREILGHGGMGCIYIAEDTKAKKKVALKVLSSEHEVDSGMLTRMKLEAKAGMQLRHPKIAATYRFDQTGAVTYMVMELVRGVSLHELIALNGKLTPKMACDIGRQIASGLQYAHDQDIIHRDVKPANFLVETDGSAKILDFGLALLKGDAEEEFSLQMIFGHDCLGTPDYIAPEQTRNSTDVDGRADIYSLGCTLYLMLTGQLPFPMKTTPQKLEAQRKLQAKSIAEIIPDIDPQIVAIVERMMQKQPDQRYPNMQEVVDALTPFAKQSPVRFEFREILSMRAKYAKKRQAGKPQRKSPRSSSIGGESEWVTSSSKTLQPEVETLVNNTGDTSPIVDTGPPVHATEKPAASHSADDSTIGEDWWVENLQTGYRILLRKTPFTIGRDPTCSLRIEGPGVSSRHCVLTYEDGEWLISDLDSKNGVYLNERQVKARQLESGDIFSLGQHMRLLITDTPPMPAAAPESDRDWKQIALIGGIGVVALTLFGLLLRAML